MGAVLGMQKASMPMRFDRFDILSAYYLFGMLWHSGQWSREYAYMGRALNAGFRPSLNFGLESLSENGRLIYEGLVKREAERFNDVSHAHRWLCHSDGSECEDGCDVGADPDRIARYRALPSDDS